jgi:sugar transferase (PEP-CTERM/EpsH1 system associated)
MRDLLFLAHRIPYPPNKGDKIRSWNLLRFLSERFRVHLGCFIDDPDDEQHRPVVEEICASCHFVPLNPKMAKLRSLSAFLLGGPLTLRYYKDQGLQDWTMRTIAENQICDIFVFSSSMAQFIEGKLGAGGDGINSVIDFVDVDSDKWRQYAAAKSWPESLIYRRESRTLLEYERRIAKAADVSFFVSKAEADLFRSLAPEAASSVHALNNGVDLEYFSPERRYENPFAEGDEVLVFTGAMDYWANVDAVSWFVSDVLPLVHARRPATQFCIVGSNPTATVRALGNSDGVMVTGRVPDVRPYVAHASCVVAPLRLARGVQNKVLEAMAMSRPVIATPEALEGIDAAIGTDILRADTAGAFATTVLDLLQSSDRGAIGQNARLFVESGYGWEANLQILNQFFDSGSLELPETTGV